MGVSTTTLLGVVWGLLYSNVAFAHLSSKTLKLASGAVSIEVLKGLYVVGLCVAACLFCLVVSKLLGAIGDLKRLSTPVAVSAPASLPPVSRINRFLTRVSLLIYYAAALGFGVGLLLIGDQVFSSDITGYHMALVGGLFLVVLVDVTRTAPGAAV